MSHSPGHELPAAGVPALLYSPAEVSGLLAISRDQVFKLMRSGALPYVRIGRFYRICVEDVREFIRAARTERAPTDVVRIRAIRAGRVEDVVASGHPK